MDRIYICIDLKSFYASVECVSRGLDPMKARLLVADESRSDQTICLAVSPPLKAIGVPSRPRLFEAKQAIERYERANRFSYDTTWGTDFPYSGVFWSDLNDTNGSDISISFGGTCRMAEFNIYVGDKTVVSESNCSAHKEWKP